MSAKRGALARIGIALLNFLAPGLGLLRIGRWQLAGASYGALLVAYIFVRFGPIAPFPVWAMVMFLMITVFIFSIAASWWLSRIDDGARPAWRRWYAIAGAALIAFGVNLVALDKDKIAYRNFYLPSDGMAPTLVKGDRFVAYMRPAVWRRGDVLLVRAGGEDIYVKRLVGFPGDTIQLSAGLLTLNGRPILQRRVATEQFKDVSGTAQATKLAEQFPGESSTHHVYGLGMSPGDDFGPVVVRPGHYFFMGDNRDRSADSRFSPADFGLAEVRSADILGRGLFYSWFSTKPMGTPLAGRP